MQIYGDMGYGNADCLATVGGKEEALWRHVNISLLLLLLLLLLILLLLLSSSLSLINQ